MIFRKPKYLALAKEAIECGDLEEAIGHYEDYLAKTPADVKTRHRLAKLYIDVGRPGGAIAHYQAIVEELRSSGLALKAESVCRTILKIDDSNEWAEQALTELQDIREAVIDTRAVWRKDSGILDADDVGAMLEDDGFEVLDTAFAVVQNDDDAEVVELDLDGALIGETDEGAEVHSELLAELPIFRELPRAAFDDLLDGVVLWQTPKDGVLVREGERGENIFIIASGKVRVMRNARTVAYLQAGDLFGEMAYLSGLPRSSTVTAVVDSRILEVTRDTLNRIRAQHAGADKAIHLFFRSRMITNVLDAPIFRDIKEDVRRDIMRGFRTVRREKGQAILCEGKPTKALYVILAGRLRVSQRGTQLAELTEGDVCGEIGLFYGENASATVTATTPVQLLRLSKNSFASFCERHPPFAQRLKALSVERNAKNGRKQVAL